MSKSTRQFEQARRTRSFLFEPNQSQSSPSIQQHSNLIEQARVYYKDSRVLETISCLTLHNNTSYTAEAHYMLGVCYMTLEKYDSALPHFELLFVQQPQFGENTRLLYSLCCLKLGLNERGFAQAKKGISKNDMEPQFYLVRAKMHLKQGNFEDSLEDCRKAKELKLTSSLAAMPENSLNFDVKLLLLESQTYLGLRKETECFEVLSTLQQNIAQLENQSKIKKKIWKTKIKAYLQFKNLEQAENVLKEWENSGQSLKESEFLYYKGVVLAESNNQQSTLCWSEVVNNPQTKPQLLSKCLEEMSVYYMKNRDFYESLQVLMRSRYLFPERQQSPNFKKNAKKPMKSPSYKVHSSKFEKPQSAQISVQGSQSLTMLLKLVQGVTYLMKRKFDEAKTMLLSIKTKQFNHLSKHSLYLNNLYFNALGFTYFSIGEHKTALEKYENMKVQPDNEPKSLQYSQYHYNTTLCRGIMAAKIAKTSEEQTMAINYFEKCTQYLVRSEPYFYISVLLIKRSLIEMATTQVFMKVLNILDAGLRVGQNSHMFYYRGLLYLYLGMNTEAIDDVDRAIEKSEDNVARYFFLRGAIFMLDRNYEQAVAEFTTCISIDDKCKDAYLQRGKCHMLIGENVSSAYLDIFEHSDYEKWRRIFSLYQREFEQLQQTKGDETIKQIASFYQFKFEKAGPAGKLVLACKNQNYEQVIPLLDEAMDINLAVGALGPDDILFLKAYCLYQLGKFGESSQVLDEVEEMIRAAQKSAFDYGEEDERRLLMAKLNQIQIKLKQRKFEEAIARTQQLSGDVYQGDIYDQLRAFSEFLVKLEARNKKQSENKQIQELTDQFTFTMFDEVSSLSDYFDWEVDSGVRSKFWIPFPKVRVHQLYEPNYQKVINQFGIEDVENKPEAPWICRGEHGVIFTNEIQHFDNLSLHTQETEHNKSKLREELQLGSDLLAKLNRITKKGSR